MRSSRLWAVKEREECEAQQQRGVRLVLIMAGLEQFIAPCLSFPACKAATVVLMPSSEGAGADVSTEDLLSPYVPLAPRCRCSHVPHGGFVGVIIVCVSSHT